MLAFRRTFYVDQEHNAKYPDLHQALTRRLRDMLLTLFPDEHAAKLMDLWPMIEDDGTTQRLAIASWEFQSDHSLRLLKTLLKIDDWRIELNVGQPKIGPLVVYEEVHWYGAGREIPLADYPNTIHFLKPFETTNIEGYKSAIIPLQKNKIHGFISFLQSPIRQLPVIFYAVQRRIPTCTQPEVERVQEKLWGLAYVVEAQNRETVDLFNQLLKSHPVYFGALRLYMPYFQPSDSPWQHPFWPCRREPEEVFSELLNAVAQESIRTEKNPEIEALQRQREVFQNSEAIRLRQEALRSREAQDDAETWENLADDLENEFQKLLSEKQEIEKESSALRDKVRQLEWRLNRQWNISEDNPSESEIVPQLLLSKQAKGRFDAMEHDERQYWTKHIFPKLLKPDQRKSQSEVISGSKGGVTLVFLRSRTHNGRRIIYFMQGENIHVCELFTSSEHDDYSRLRTEGPDRANYVNFEEFRIS